MVTIGKLSGLLVLREMLDSPKSLHELHLALDRTSKGFEVPILMPRVEDFLEDHMRLGTVMFVSDSDTSPGWKIRPEAAGGVRAELEQASQQVGFDLLSSTSNGSAREQIVA